MYGIKKKLGVQTGALMLMMLAFAGLLGPSNVLQTPTKRSNYVLWALFVAVDTSVRSTSPA